MPPRRILVITGASGSGKSAVLQAIAARQTPGIRVHHFDSVGVPTPEAMTRDYGSPQEWQTVVTHQWITRLATDPDDTRLAVLEGQVRPATVQEAFRTNAVRHGRILLLDCAPDVREMRLRGPRAQPDLATAQMMAWSAYLRGQADALRIPVLDTTSLSLEDATREVERHMAAIAAAAD